MLKFWGNRGKSPVSQHYKKCWSSEEIEGNIGKGKYIVKAVDQPLKLPERLIYKNHKINSNKQIKERHEDVKYDTKM